MDLNAVEIDNMNKNVFILLKDQSPETQWHFLHSFLLECVHTY